jgi:hypothetical protein
MRAMNSLRAAAAASMETLMIRRVAAARNVHGRLRRGMSEVDPVASGKPRRHLAVASFVLGLLGFCGWPFCRVGPLLGLVLAVAAIVLARVSPGRFAAGAAAFIGLVFNSFALYLSLAGPAPSPGRDMMRWKPRHWRQAELLQDVRAVQSAQAAYAEHNGGHYDTLACVNEPRKCNPNAPEGAAGLQASLVAGEPRLEYQRTFHPGPSIAPADIVKQGVSPSSMNAFAFVAAPIESRPWYRRLDEQWWRPEPAFCGDHSGRICIWRDGRPRGIIAGRCPLQGFGWRSRSALQGVDESRRCDRSHIPAVLRPAPRQTAPASQSPIASRGNASASSRRMASGTPARGGSTSGIR